MAGLVLSLRNIPLQALVGENLPCSCACEEFEATLQNQWDRSTQLAGAMC